MPVSPFPFQSQTETEPRPQPQQPTIWSSEETETLISSYQEIWYSLNRTQLNSSHWSHISQSVNTQSHSHLPKSPTQCRHKLEKLRKRYRLELTKPPHSISWPYFPLLHRLHNAPDSIPRETETETETVTETKKRRRMDCGWGDGMRDFVDMFVKLEKMKMEIIRDNERFRIEMQNKRLQMIILSHHKSIDFVHNAFGLNNTNINNKAAAAADL